MAKEYPKADAASLIENIPWVIVTFLFIGLYRLASKSIVQPDIKLDLALAKIIRELDTITPPQSIP